MRMEKTHSSDTHHEETLLATTIPSLSTASPQEFSIRTLQSCEPGIDVVQEQMAYKFTPFLVFNSETISTTYSQRLASTRVRSFSDFPMKRAGRNDSASGQYCSLWWMDVMLRITDVRAGIEYVLPLDAMKFAGCSDARGTM